MHNIRQRTGITPCLVTFLATSLLSTLANAAGFTGIVKDEIGQPIVGAMVTTRFHLPFQERTVFTDQQGRFMLSDLPTDAEHTLRVRRIGWHDIRSNGHSVVEGNVDPLSFVMQRHTDPAEVAAQLPANHWYELVLNEVESEHDREQFVRQCTFCHQQGNPATRLLRDEGEWQKVLALMARMGAGLDAELAERMPAILNRAYNPATAIPALTEGWEDAHGFAPPRMQRYALPSSTSFNLADARPYNMT